MTNKNVGSLVSLDKNYYEYKWMTNIPATVSLSTNIPDGPLSMK